jgi:chorismate mutase
MPGQCTDRIESMQLTSRKLAIRLAVALACTGVAYPQSNVDQLRLLVDASMRRIAIAQKVALAKWDSGAPVEDTAREADVIAGAVKDGESKNLEPDSVANFFKAQIEANKLVQYSLLADWRRAGQAPNHAPISLSTTIRPELDRLQNDLIASLANTAVLRTSSTCPSDVAKAVGNYLAFHKTEQIPLYRIALDRALAVSCERERPQR